MGLYVLLLLTVAISSSFVLLSASSDYFFLNTLLSVALSLLLFLNVIPYLLDCTVHPVVPNTASYKKRSERLTNFVQTRNDRHDSKL
jgi:hypothetical protein